MFQKVSNPLGTRTRRGAYQSGSSGDPLVLDEGRRPEAAARRAGGERGRDASAARSRHRDPQRFAGRLDLALPVRGNVDHPQFSYGHLVWQALVNVITKVATAPFRALAGLFGGGSDNVEAVVFEAGSDAVPPPEREKLKRVAEVLGKRPRLKLIVHGRYEAKATARRCARFTCARIWPDRPKTQRALERLAAERGVGRQGVSGHLREDEREEGRARQPGAGDARPRRGRPRLLRGSLPSPGRDRVTGRADLTALGRRRREATARAVKESVAASAERVDIGSTEAADRAERYTVSTRLELGAATGS
jgi:hypothetical protein